MFATKQKLEGGNDASESGSLKADAKQLQLQITCLIPVKLEWYI